MRKSDFGRTVGRLISKLKRIVGVIDTNKITNSPNPGESFIELDHEILEDPAKCIAIFNYLASQERFNTIYNSVSWYHFHESLQEIPKCIGDQIAQETNTFLHNLDHGIDVRRRELEKLGLKPSAIDNLKLTSDRFAETLWSVRPDHAAPNSLRLLPILRIHDTDFYVDLKYLEFRQVDNARNTIAFQNVQDHWTYTSVLYDPQTKNVYRGTEAERSARPDVVLVQLPARTQLDTQYWAERVTENAREEYLKARKKKEETAGDDETSDNKQLGRNHRRSI